ncbi:MAG: hypothetical protein ABH830_01395 [Patescibacteria group bacterium]
MDILDAGFSNEYIKDNMQTATFPKINQRANMIAESDQMLSVQLIKERLSGPFLSWTGIKKKIKQDFKKFKIDR